ncbi:hypothetical protein TrRE_jg12324, partial [Triparma retinervis]
MPHPDAIRKLFPILGSLGLSSVAYISSELSDPSHKATSALWPEKFDPLLDEGLAQCCRPRAPEIRPLQKVRGFDKALEEAVGATQHDE